MRLSRTQGKQSSRPNNPHPSPAVLTRTIFQATINRQSRSPPRRCSATNAELDYDHRSSGIRDHDRLNWLITIPGMRTSHPVRHDQGAANREPVRDRAVAAQVHLRVVGRTRCASARSRTGAAVPPCLRASRVSPLMRSIVLSRFYRGELAELRRVSIGPDLVFGRLWRETGCAEVIRALLVGRRFGFDVERAIYLTVLHRLMVLGSDRHASRWTNGCHRRGPLPPSAGAVWRSVDRLLRYDIAVLRGRRRTDAGPVRPQQGLSSAP